MKQFEQPYETYYFWTTYSFSKLVAQEKRKKYLGGKKVKGKAVPLQAWSSPGGSRKLRFPDLHDNGTGWW
jgi:hypothetical protein